MLFWGGRTGFLGNAPPMYLRSTAATRLPSPANVVGGMVEPVPPPRITRSNSSGCVFLRTWADGEVSVLFKRLFLSERPVHSGLSLISPGQPPTLPPATVHSRPPGQCALSTVE